MRIPSILFGLLILVYVSSTFAESNSVNVINSSVTNSSVIQGSSNLVTIRDSRSRYNSVSSYGDDSVVSVDGVTFRKRNDTVSIDVPRGIRFIEIRDPRNATCLYDIYQQAVRYCR